MGKQSARLYCQGKDHKDIYFRLNFHDAMYKGSRLVWNKIYPSKYFVATHHVQTAGFGGSMVAPKPLLMFAPGLVEEKSVWYSYYPNRGGRKIAFNDSSSLVLAGSRSRITKDFRTMKNINNHVISVVGYSPIGKSYISLGEHKIIRLDENMEIYEKTFSYPRSGIIYTLTGLSSYGNYAIAYIKADDYEEWNKHIYYEIVDELGNVNEIECDTNAQEPPEYQYWRYMRESSIKIIMWEYIYYYVPPMRIYGVCWDGGFIKRSLRNISSMEFAIRVEYGADYVSPRVIFASKEKILFLMLRRTSEYYDVRIIRIDAIGTIVDKTLNRSISVKVYGDKDRTIAIRPFNSTEKIDKNVIYLYDSQFLASGEPYCSIDFSEFPTVRNGEISLDAIDGMLMYFTYGNDVWRISGYLYIDNFSFEESENNYIYILSEYENGQTIYERYPND